MPTLGSILDTCSEHGVPPIPRDAKAEAVFAEPWQAEAFATTIQLSGKGLFTWPEWVQVFSAEIKANPQETGESAADAYFRQWLAALERIVVDRATVTRNDLSETHEHWRRSYLNTDHGNPVRFSRGWGPILPDDMHTHEHHHHHESGHAPKPIAISAPGSD